MDADDLSLLDAVIAEGGITAAALKLKLPKTTVSRRLKRLEAAAGASLFDRTGRKLRLTLLGQTLAVPAAQLRASLLEARALAQAAHGGHVQLRIATPFLFGRIVLAHFLAGFLAAREKVTGILRYDNAQVDPLREDVDIAIRIGRPTESYLTVAKLATARLQLYASPELARRIETIADLAACPAVHTANQHAPSAVWTLAEGRQRHELRVDVRCTVNDPEAASEMVAQGLGVGALPGFIAGAMVEDGRIAPVLPRLAAGEVVIHAVLPPGRLRIPVVRQFLDGLKAELDGRRFGSLIAAG